MRNERVIGNGDRYANEHSLTHSISCKLLSRNVLNESCYCKRIWTTISLKIFRIWSPLMNKPNLCFSCLAWQYKYALFDWNTEERTGHGYGLKVKPCVFLLDRICRLYVPIKWKLQHPPPGQPPGHLNFWILGCSNSHPPGQNRCSNAPP